MIPLSAGMFDEEGAGGWGLQGWTGLVLSSPQLGSEGSKVTPGEHPGSSTAYSRGILGSPGTAKRCSLNKEQLLSQS